MIDPAQLAHLLRRTEYVARPERMALLGPGTLDAAIDDILDFSGIDTTLPSTIDHDNPDNRWEQYVLATKWWFDRMAFDSPKPMQEKMTFFWHGHFTSAYSKVNSVWAITHQNKLYRDNAVGNFANLTQAMAIEPAMLAYLDNDDNSEGSPNQNFARELMELFTLGVGNYSEDDVIASARAWTGHGLSPWVDDSPTFRQYEFHPTNHDDTNKTFFGVTRNWNGPDIIDEILVNNAAKKMIAARFIVAKVWGYLAYPGPPTAVVDALAPGFAANWNIKTMLKAMLLRSEFYETAATQGLVRSPVDWIVAVLYYSKMRSDVLNPQWYTEGMGQEPFDPPNVSGWKSNGYWVNTSAIGARANFAQNAAYQLHKTKNYDYLAKISTTTVDQAIDAVAGMFGLAPLSAVTRGAMTAYMNAQRAVEPWLSWAEVDNLLLMGLLAPEMHVS